MSMKEVKQVTPATEAAKEAGASVPMEETQVSAEVMEELTMSDHEVDDDLNTLGEGCRIAEGATTKDELWIGCDGVDCQHGKGWWHQRCTVPDVTHMSTRGRIACSTKASPKATQ